MAAGYNLGGGAVVQLDPYVALWGDFTFARRPFRENGTTNGVHVFNYFYDGAIQLQYPTASGLEPYVYAGGGGVTFHQEDTDGVDRTRDWLYKVNDFPTGTVLSGVDRWQYDVAWTGGISYRLPI